jgi:hypothetical protein
MSASGQLQLGRKAERRIMMPSEPRFKEKTVNVEEEPRFCPKVKGGRRYQIEVLRKKCERCKVKQKYCPELLKRKE